MRQIRDIIFRYYLITIYFGYRDVVTFQSYLY